MMTDGLRLPRKVAAEMVGTFTLVYAGCGAIAVDATTGALGHVGVALVFGLAVTVMVYATGHISGAHFNPAVTVAFATIGRFPWKEVPAYVGGQCAAAILAAGLVRLTFGDVTLGVTRYDTVATALGVEAAITFMLMFVIVAVATDSRAVGQMAGIAIGGTVAMCALFAGPVTGASMNPARSLGPALVTGQVESLWLYVVAPIVGAALGAFTYRLLKCSDEPSSDARGCC